MRIWGKGCAGHTLTKLNALAAASIPAACPHQRLPTCRAGHQQGPYVIDLAYLMLPLEANLACHSTFMNPILLLFAPAGPTSWTRPTQALGPHVAPLGMWIYTFGRNKSGPGKPGLPQAYDGRMFVAGAPAGGAGLPAQKEWG